MTISTLPMSRPKPLRNRIVWTRRDRSPVIPVIPGSTPSHNNTPPISLNQSMQSHGSREKINMAITGAVHRGSDIIRVEALDTTIIVNGSAEIWVRVTDNYASKLMNVYEVLAPAAICP